MSVRPGGWAPGRRQQRPTHLRGHRNRPVGCGTVAAVWACPLGGGGSGAAAQGSREEKKGSPWAWPGLAFLLEGSWAAMAGKVSGLTRLGCV